MKLKVLIFDDDELILGLLTKLISSRGHEVLSYSEPTICPLYSDSSCTCPREAPCADILITDYNMPNMTGLEFVRHQSLRGCKGINKHKAIMSGGWVPEDLQLAQSLGCKTFSKPTDMKAFFTWFEECENDY